MLIRAPRHIFMMWIRMDVLIPAMEIRSFWFAGNAMVVQAILHWILRIQMYPNICGESEVQMMPRPVPWS